MPKQTLINLFDLDALIITLIGVGTFMDIDSQKVVEYILNPENILYIVKECFKLAISLFSVLILYKKYKKLK